MYLNLRNFKVINIVGAVSLEATFNCEAFAEAHKATSYFDKSSFVGLAWRPPMEPCCVEVYGTGRANLPGCRDERSLLAAFYRMLPELLRYSGLSSKLVYIPNQIQDIHRRDSANKPAIKIKHRDNGKARKMSNEDDTEAFALIDELGL